MQETATARRRELNRGLGAGIFIFLLVAGTIAALLFSPGGTLLGDTTNHVIATAPLPRITEEEPFRQTFEASDDRMSAVSARFGTYAENLTCTLRVIVTEASQEFGTGSTVADANLPCASLPDSADTQAISFEPVADSEGERYDITIEISDESAGWLGPSLWAGPSTDPTEHTLEPDGTTSELTGIIRPHYDPQPHAWNHIGEMLDRISQYGAPWATPGYFISLVALLALALAVIPWSTRSRAFLVIAVCGLALVRSLLWSAVLPPMAGVDEPQHFDNVQAIAENHRLPGEDSDGVYLGQQVELAAQAAHITAAIPGDRPDYEPGEADAIATTIGTEPASGGGYGPASGYSAAYYLPAVPLYELAPDNIFNQISITRLWSAMLGVIAAGLSVLIGRQLFPGRPTAQAAFAAAVILQPVLSQAFSIVNNDAWVILAGFMALSVGLALARRARASWLALAAGAILGMALLGKPFGIAAAVPLLVGWIAGKVTKREKSLVVYLRETGLAFLGVAATYGTWMALTRVLNIRVNGITPTNPEGLSINGFLSILFGNRLEPARSLWGMQLWGSFGWVRIRLPQGIIQVIWVAEVLIAIALVVWLVGWIIRRLPRMENDVAAVSPDSTSLAIDTRILLVGTTIAGMAVSIYGAAFVYYMRTGLGDLIQGRYALMAIPAFIAAPGLLLERFSGGRIPPERTNVVIAIFIGFCSVLALWVTMEAFYG